MNYEYGTKKMKVSLKRKLEIAISALERIKKDRLDRFETKLIAQEALLKIERVNK